jgi:phytoene dehydrogenase-like protein
VTYDDIVVGAGHNGLTAAAYLARAGRRVLVLERADYVGGAAVSSRAFPGVDARLSRYSYLVSLLPKQVLADLDLDVRMQRRRYSSYTPLTQGQLRGLLIDDEDDKATAAAFAALTGSGKEFAAWRGFYDRCRSVAARIFPTVLEPLRSSAQMRDLAGDDELWSALVERPVGALLRDRFSDDTVRGIVATDALIGTFADLDSASRVQNVCLLYHLMGGGTGSWDVPIGGMGAVTDALAAAAEKAGATILTRAEVTDVSPDGTVGWTYAGTRERATVRSPCGTVLSGVAPAVLNRLLAASGAGPIETEAEPEGAQVKVNMLLSRLPRLRDRAVDPAAAFAGTLHVNEGFEQLQTAYAAAEAGVVPDVLPLEIYCHSLTDRSIFGDAIANSEVQTLTAFALNLPTRLFRADNATARATALAAAIRSINTVLDEPLQSVILRDSAGRLCLEVHTPVDLEEDLALPGGNIFHRSLQWPWAETEAQVGTWGVETAYNSVMLCGAGARRGGGVSAIPGHNAARAVVERS